MYQKSHQEGSNVSLCKVLGNASSWFMIEWLEDIDIQSKSDIYPVGICKFFLQKIGKTKSSL